MEKPRRGGHLSLNDDFIKALGVVNQSVDDIVREHLTREELDELCAIWNTDTSGERLYDADRVLKAMHSQPSFINHMAMTALVAKSVGTASHFLRYYDERMIHPSQVYKAGFYAFLAGPLVYGLRYMHGKYKDSAKSKETIRILLGAIQRLNPRKSGRKGGRVSTRRRFHAIERRASTRRGGHLTLDNDTQTALSIVNKTVHQIVHQHLTLQELHALCAIWKVDVTGNRSKDAVRVYREMESQPGFLKTMYHHALMLMRNVLLNNVTIGAYANLIMKGSPFEKAGKYINLASAGIFLIQPLIYAFRHIHGRYKDTSKSEETIQILLKVMERIKHKNLKPSQT